MVYKTNFVKIQFLKIFLKQSQYNMSSSVLFKGSFVKSDYSFAVWSLAYLFNEGFYNRSIEILRKLKIFDFTGGKGWHARFPRKNDVLGLIKSKFWVSSKFQWYGCKVSLVEQVCQILEF